MRGEPIPVWLCFGFFTQRSNNRDDPQLLRISGEQLERRRSAEEKTKEGEKEKEEEKEERGEETHRQPLSGQDPGKLPPQSSFPERSF